jgi:uncharacterized protein YjbI with pentapeptide repeats/beta-lactamase regulating signal transducer with metallopeptidase domain
MSGNENLSQIGVAFAHALFDGLWMGAIVALAVHLLLRSRNNMNAATRHAAWYAALVVVAAMPVVSFCASLARIQVSTQPARTILVERAPDQVAFAPPSGVTPAAADAAPASSGSDLLDSSVVRQSAIAVAIVAGGVALARVLILVSALFGLARVKRASRIVDPSTIPSLARTIARDTGSRAVDLRISDSIETPAAAGFRTPAILLPEGLVESLDDDALGQIAMHEYAHLRRYDDWSNLGQRIVERLYWFNPAVWFVSSQVDLEREIACDDWAVAGGKSVSTYADCLWHLARDGRLPSFASTAPGAFSKRKQISVRIEHLLEQRRNGDPVWRPGKLVAVAPILAAALAIAVGRAPAIALRMDSPAQVAVIGAPAVTLPRSAADLLAAAPLRGVVVAVPVAVPTCTPHPQIRVFTVRLDSADIARTAERTTRTMLVTHTIVIRRMVSAVRIRQIGRKSVDAGTARTAQTVAVSTRPDGDSDVTAIAATAASAASTIVAAASETDDYSDTPADRNILAHCAGCDLSGQDLRNVDLHGLTLTGDDFSGADLRGADLRGTTLTGVDLSDAKLDGADLRGAVLTGTDIDGATFTGAKTDGIKLVGMQITDSLIASSSARSVLASCGGCDLTGLSLRDRDLHGITLDGVDLSGVDFSGANLSGVRFNGVDLEDAKFVGTDLTNAKMFGCDLGGVDLSHARTSGLELQGSDLSETPSP